MSKSIDEKVVSMRFDNKDFEHNVQTSLSTLDKLKSALHLDGATKGLENLGSAAKNVDFKDFEAGATQAGFHVQDIFEKVTRFLENDIARRIVDVGTRIAKEFTIEPIKTGFEEFELKMGSVQTILAGTGEDLATVNKYLEELNVYSDKTIYSFSDMTNNIGKFTNAGVKLEDAVAAIKGISNEAAVSGANANEASRAMYNFSQALSAGYVKLIDWKSIENANMATVEFKDTLLQTALAMGTVVEENGLYVTTTTDANGKVSDAFNATMGFNDALSHQWMTTEVLTQALSIYSTDVREMSEAEKAAYEEKMRGLGYTDEQIEKFEKLGMKAFDAAQDVKTFSMMMDTLKEAAQSGWAQTWELIVGDFENGKKLWTELANMFGGIIDNSAKARNELIKGALYNNDAWGDFGNAIKNAGVNVDTFIDAIADSQGYLLEDDRNIYNLIEKYGSFEEALKHGALSSEDFANAIQEFNRRAELTNGRIKTLDDSVVGLYGSLTTTNGALYNNDAWGDFENSIKNAGVNVDTFIDAIADSQGYLLEDDRNIYNLIEKYGSLEEALKHGALSSEDFANAIQEFNRRAELTNGRIKTLDDSVVGLYGSLTTMNGRELLIDTFRNSLEAVGKIISTVRDAWKEVFPPVTSDQLHNIIEALHTFSEKLILSEERLSKLKDTFKGVFSILDIFRKIIVSVGKGVINALDLSGLGGFADALLTKASEIGNFFTSLDEGLDTSGITKKTEEIVRSISDFVNQFFIAISGFKGLLPSMNVDITSILGSIAEGIKSIFSALFDSGSIGDIGSALSTAWDSFKMVFDNVWGGVKTVFGGIGNGIKTLFSFLSEHISLGDIFGGLAAGGVFAAAKSFIKLIDQLRGAFENLFGKNDGPSGIKEKFHDILESVKDSLQSFTSGIKITSLVSIAGAIGILTLSLSKISELNGIEITKSLSTIGVMMTMLCASFKSLTKTLDKFDSKGVIKAGISLVLIAVALDVLADALTKIGQLSLKELVKGLIGVGGGLAELAVGLKIIDKVKISLSTSIAILALAASCGMLADALKKFGEMSWKEIGHGLVAMGLALGELVAAVSVLGKFGGFSSLLGAAGVWVIIKGMDDLAEALKKFGEMSWTEIGHGLVAMGGALLEVSGFAGALGKIAGFAGILGAATIRLVIGGLDELADSLKKFGEMTWSEIGRGLTAMGGALLEVSGFAGALGKIAGFSGILGAASILIVIQGLDKLADALIKFGSMSWSEIGRGLTAMGGALLEVAGFSGALGMIAGFAGILGAAAILIVIQGLDKLANAFKKFGDMSWGEIGRGLVAMGGALLEVAGFSGALGMIAGFAGLLGAGSILIAVQGLGDLADALKKFGEMNWDEIGRGLTAMGAALGELAVGGLINSFSILGSLSIAALAKPLGDLADSVKKWNGVVIPKGLGLELGKLAVGVMAFTYDGLGALSIAALAEPLGTLADSVKKWQGVTVPPAIGSQLKKLADGVKAFSWCFLAGWSLSALSQPLGDLAVSVRKWAGVTIPEGIGDQLKDLSAGVKSFSWAFMGAWSIDALVDPLTRLPDAVRKWNNIKIPENLKEELTSLADGIKSFSWAFMGAWSIDAIIEPLGNLATAVRKWQGVNIPSDVTTNLKNFSSVIVTFANNVKPLSTINSNGIVMFANSITILNTAVARIVSVDIDRINAFIIAVQKLGGLKIDVSSLMDSSVAVSTAIRTMMQSVNQIISSSRQTVNSSMKMAMSGMASTVKSISPSVTAAIKDVLSGFTKTINSQKGTVTNAFKNLVSDAAGAIKSNQAAIASAGKDLGQGFVSGVNSKSPASKDAGNTLAASAIDGAKRNQAAMASVGKDLGQGLVSGIKSKEQDAYDAGYALGQAAVQGEKDGQQSNSPSKLTIKAGNWIGEGLVIGMDRMCSAVYSSGKSMGEEAVNSISGALSQIGDMSTEDLAVQPTIKPVIDMTNLNSNDVQLGANVNAYLTKPIDSLSAIIANAQDEMNLSNNEVIKVISGLREDLNSLYEMVSGKETNLYVDSKKLATSLAKPMNRELNILSKRGAY